MTTRPVVDVTVIRPVVLVVDDDPGVLEALRALLAPRLEPIYRVETAASAEEALELAASYAPDVHPLAAVISDEKMPGRQGTELLIALRQSPAHRHGGRIIVTGYAGLESAKRAINEAEVVRYYPKPWDDEKQLLPALAEILTRFARKSELDECLLAAARDWVRARPDVEALRRAWWEYLTLMGMSAAEAEVDEPPFIEAEDEHASSVHVLVTRRSPRGDHPAASLRLGAAEADGQRPIGAVAFLPEEANAATETLLIRTALLEARTLGTRQVRAEVPILRREVYEALGFVAISEPEEHSGTVLMSVPTGRGAILDGPLRAYALRHDRERRQCRCAQASCPLKDYSASSRAYLCPLDATEGRLPLGFPLGRGA